MQVMQQSNSLQRSWLDVEFDAKTSFLELIEEEIILGIFAQIYGLDNEGVLSRFYTSAEFVLKEKNQVVLHMTLMI